MEDIILRHVYGNVMRVAIPLTQRVRTLVEGVETETETDFYPNPDFPVKVNLTRSDNMEISYEAEVDGNVVSLEDKGEIPVGTYGISVLCYDNMEQPCRYMARKKIKVVAATKDAGIEAGVEFNTEDYTLEGTIFYFAKGDKGDKGDNGVGIPEGGSEGQVLTKNSNNDYDTRWESFEGIGFVTDKNYVHTDNNFTDADKAKVGSAITEETDPTVPSWAKQPNKPAYTAQEVGALPADTPIPTKTSDLINDSGFLTEHQDISGKVDKIAGKGLSTNDYTDADKAKLAGLHNYDDTEVRNLIADNSVAVETKNAASTLSVSADKLTVISGAVGTSAITLQVPNDNKAHVWDIMMSTDSSVDIIFAMSNGATILKPSGFSVATSKNVEISVIGVGTKYYLRYGEFTSE